MKKEKRNLVIGSILAILIISTLIYFSTPQSIIFNEGFEPYGESTTQITGLTPTKFVSNNIDNRDAKSYEIGYDSKYWDIIYAEGLTGNDFSISANGKCYYVYNRGSKVCSNFQGLRYTNFLEMQTKEDFSNRDFKIEVEIDVGKLSVEGVTLDGDGTILISPSPISNEFTIYKNGQKEKTFIKSGEFRPKIVANGECTEPWENPPCYQGKVIIKNPSWREQYGCSKRPNEQYYVKIFNEGSEFKLNDLDYWNKFCLTQPVKIYTNAGSTTTKEPLTGLLEDKSYTVPPGQIWVLEYIGELQGGQTECESNKVFNLAENKCMARTLIEFNFGDQTITKETEEAQYLYEDIITHQNLEKKDEFLFEHIIDDGESSENTFNIGQNTFNSNYENEQFSFNYNGQEYNAIEGKEYELDNHLSVRIVELKDDSDPEGDLNDAIIKYIFEIDTSFIKIGLQENKLIISNDYQPFNGGIFLTTTNNIDQTKVERIEKTLNQKTEFALEDNLREIKARPFIEIETPRYNYLFETDNAYSSSFSFTSYIEDQYNKQNYLFYLIPLTLLILIAIFLWRKYGK